MKNIHSKPPFQSVTRVLTTGLSACLLGCLLTGVVAIGLGACSSTPAVFDPKSPTFSDNDDELPPLSDRNSQATTLYQLGVDHFEASDYAKSEFYFRKVVVDFPGSTYQVRAKYFLGLCYIKLNQGQQAEKFLRDYVENTAPVAEGRVGRVALARAELMNGKPHEALLNLDEAIGDSIAALPLEKSLEALILRSRSYIALKQESDARLASDAFISLYEKSATEPNQLVAEEIKAEGYEHRLQIKNKECSELASREPLDESSAMDQYKRRRLCMAENIRTYVQSTQFKSDAWQKRLAETMIRGIDEFYQRAIDPPAPPKERSPTDRTLRTQKEIEIYRVELRHLFLKIFGEFRRETLDILQNQAKSLPLLQQKGLHEVHESLRRRSS